MISSIRWEATRAGLEDAEYFVILQRQLTTLRALCGAGRATPNATASRTIALACAPGALRGGGAQLRNPTGNEGAFLDFGGAFAFASEPQALIRSGLVPVEENADALHELFQLQFTCRRETVFAGIQRVLPGETLVVCAGQIIERIHRPALPLAPPEDWNGEDLSLIHISEPTRPY